MIKIENVEVYGWEAAIRGMRNPMNSWDKSDSDCKTIIRDNGKYVENFVGDNDLALMKRLVKAGSDHSKFMRMINVTVDITAPLYWWKEFDTYKVGTVRNSCSTMHKIHSKEFEMDDFSHEHLIVCKWVDELGVRYRTDNESMLMNIIQQLNCMRERYLETKYKEYWWQLIQLLPSSYNQRATVQLNYAVLRNIYNSRKNHKLDEWSEGFTTWVKSLPYSELITDEM